MIQMEEAVADQGDYGNSQGREQISSSGSGGSFHEAIVTEVLPNIDKVECLDENNRND
jgi:hypothetical protein